MIVRGFGIFLKYPGKTAKILLECFLVNGGVLKASQVEAIGLCVPGKFKVWRDDLIKLHWLVYLIGDYSKHSSGPKLLKYINKEKMNEFELATTKDLSNLDIKIEANYVSKKTHELLVKSSNQLKDEVKKLEITMDLIINIVDPETNEFKRNKYLNGEYDEKFVQ